MQMTEKIANYSLSRGVLEIAPQKRVLTDIPKKSDDEAVVESLVGPSASSYGAWRQFLSTTGPYSYMWTHSYIHAYSDRRAVGSLWDCVKYINRSLWGPRWSKRGCGVHATVVAERHKISHALRGRLHFHVLVQRPHCEITDERFGAVVNKAALWLQDDFGRSMSATDRTDVRQVWSAEGLAAYLTKDLETQSWPTGDGIFFIRPTGIEGLVFTLRSNAQLASMH